MAERETKIEPNKKTVVIMNSENFDLSISFVYRHPPTLSERRARTYHAYQQDRAAEGPIDHLVQWGMLKKVRFPSLFRAPNSNLVCSTISRFETEQRFSVFIPHFLLFSFQFSRLGNPFLGVERTRINELYIQNIDMRAWWHLRASWEPCLRACRLIITDHRNRHYWTFL